MIFEDDVNRPNERDNDLAAVDHLKSFRLIRHELSQILTSGLESVGYHHDQLVPHSLKRGSAVLLCTFILQIGYSQAGLPGVPFFLV